MKECKHKWKKISWKPDGCGCHGTLEAVCLLCEETFDEYIYCFEPIFESCKETEEEGLW